MPTDCVSSVTIQFIAEGKKKKTLMFGISKEHFASTEYLGRLKQDWSIDLYRGTKDNDGKYIDYGKKGKV